MELDTSVERFPLEGTAYIIDPLTASEWQARVAALAPLQSLAFDNGAVVSAREEGGYLILWPKGIPFHALDAEGATLDALAYSFTLEEGESEPKSQEAKKSEFDIACQMKRDVWLPACQGTETPTRFRDGRLLLYVYNPFLARHAYLDVERDIILSEEDSLKSIIF
jgi:hypothetical protein